MPRIYLSPSTQDWNPYVDGSGSEDYWMNLLADTLEPYLYANTISFVRNTPEMTAASSIAQANSLGGFDFYLALHSNASTSHEARGPEVIVASNGRARTLANAIYNQLRTINPYPGRGVLYDTYYGELRLTKAPANLIEVDFHDNPEGAQWIIDNMNLIAEKIADGVDEYFYGQN